MRCVRFLLACALYSLTICIGFSADWVLSAREFTFTQSSRDSSTDQALSKMLPQLILEQLSADSVRLPTEDEMLSRTLDSLQTERISLFLQLSKEVHTRDSHILLEKNARKQKKAIAEAEKKIAALEEKISINLQNAEKARLQVKASLKEGPVPSAKNETVVLYKNDSSALFTPSEGALSLGETSREYERAVVAAHINGLLTGSITIYGGYAAVTVELKTFPGAQSSGIVTEVGALENVTALADSIARSLWPTVVNSLPVSLIFAIAPQDVSQDARIAIDGIVTALKNNETNVPAGTHTIEVSAPGYETKTITHRFVDAAQFLIQVSLTEKKEGNVLLFSQNTAKESKDGTFTVYAGGQFVGEQNPNEGLSLTIRGGPLIGQFVKPLFSEAPAPVDQSVHEEETEGELENDYINKEDEGKNQQGTIQTGQLTSFFYIPQAMQTADNAVLVKTALQDTSALIDKRRIWMYRGYTALILTLPFTFYSVGNYNSAYNAYYNGYVDAQEVYKWNTMRIASAGISIVAGGFFIFELVRYLRAASTVLPTTATKVSITPAARSTAQENDNEQSQGEE